MSQNDPIQLTRDQLLEYFTAAAKPRDAWLVGMEVERMGRDEKGAALPYAREGGPSIRAAIQRYQELRGGLPVLEGPNVIGLNAEWGNISLEPGGQFEWSSRPYTAFDDLADANDEHATAMDRVSRDLGITWLETAVEPELPLDAMPWMPKARYNIMRPFLSARGQLGPRMMTQTAAIQTAFDYADESDWKRKFQAASFLAPLATLLFANSSRIDGAESGWSCYRHAIWRDTDPARCMLPPVVFDADFDLERWLDHVLSVPTIFRHRAKGRVATDGVPFAELMKLEGCDALSPKDWESHVSTIFTEVRSYTYIEIRSADLQPSERAPAVPALWIGLLYDETALDAALELGERWSTYEAWDAAMINAARNGLDAMDAGDRVADLTRRMVEISIDGLRRGAACAGDGRRATTYLERMVEHVGVAG